ncbi:F-box/FBD/LRR-repeat protein At1g13570-like [Lycium ferocissimum]|uniref:F-box/FBD/LRR-repeat protein At1g13570-like n=1 Tax=Lycium ferocissimum TaxID=112874 RepID=UPI0028163239|nr:F-box/FBD/LRR-repeat protein At1g13570-like [Lycium ferocissimum]
MSAFHYAVRTSVLSREWRYWYKWAVRSKLVFDDNVDKGLLLKTVIYQVLLIHEGPLRNFSLLISNSELFPDINNWILFLSKKNVQEFSLRIRFFTEFRLTSQLFKFQDLRRLELYRHKFSSPANFTAFSRLVTLNFQFVKFNPTSFQTPLSSSPLLECVTLTWCSPFDCFVVDAPRLKSFESTGKIKSICLKKNTPLLEEIIAGQSSNILESFAVLEPHVTLRNIKLSNINLEWTAYALYLISNCPNLERLQLTVRFSSSDLKQAELLLLFLQTINLNFSFFTFSKCYASQDPSERVIYFMHSQGMLHSALKQQKGGSKTDAVF